MSKILVWNTFPLQNSGGPSGYNFNVRTYVKENNITDIIFLSDLIDITNVHTNPSIKVNNHPANIISKLYNVLRYRWGLLYNFIYGSYNEPFEGIPEGFSIDEFDYVHVHFSMHANRIKKTFPNYQGRVIITSHQPCSTVDEILDMTHYPFLKFFRHLGHLAEAKAYDAADYIMFPCRQAREPYEKVSALKESFKRNEKKFFYVPSSILDIEIDENKIQKFSELSIPCDAFVITYFGRHTPIKGYDILKEVGSRLLDKYPNLYFLCAGKGEITPLNHKRWIELGFINNAVELLYQSNLYILPNRDTYFDLVTLEILRSSTPLILSYTGGNKYFKDELPEKETQGMDFFDIDNFEELVKKVECHIEEYYHNRKEYMLKAQSNRQLFLKRFTIASFVDTYFNSVKNL